MNIHTELFGHLADRREVYLYTLDTGTGFKARVTNYGGRVVSLEVPAKDGKSVDIMLGFDSLAEYLKDQSSMGALVGRYANRIARARFVLDGVTYRLPATIHGYALHGGRQGFNGSLWQGNPFKTQHEVGLVLSLFSPHLADGFPGNLEVRVRYSFSHDFCFRIEYQAQTDRPTHINLTHHGYYNLNGMQNDILEHKVRINSSYITEVDKHKIPTGRILNIADTALDLRAPLPIKEALLRLGKEGFDHNYILQAKSNCLQLAAQVWDPTTGILMETWTTEPALQFYTANHLHHLKGKNAVFYQSFWGFCLETQHYPDTPNHPNFPPTRLDPGETFFSSTEYRFSVKEAFP